MVNMKKWLSLFTVSRRGSTRRKESWDCDQLHDGMDDHEMSFTVALCEDEEASNAGNLNFLLHIQGKQFSLVAPLSIPK